jgi:hypothetical protein
MKNLILYIFILFSVNICFADCSDSGMRFLPQKKEISLNPIFIIEGYINSQLTIKSFKNRKVYLKTENEILIELNLIEILVSQDVSQAVFKASKTLLPNTKYFLFYENQTNREKSEMLEYNQDSGKREQIFWQTTNLIEQNNIDSNLKITYSKNEIKPYGCGDSVNSVFNISSENDSEIWFKTELIEISTGQKTIMYLTSRESKLYVGKGMCGGAFKYKSKKKYKVSFTPMNIDGKQLESTKWIEFKSPFDTENNYLRRE